MKENGKKHFDEELDIKENSMGTIGDSKSIASRRMVSNSLYEFRGRAKSVESLHDMLSDEG